MESNQRDITSLSEAEIGANAEPGCKHCYGRGIVGTKIVSATRERGLLICRCVPKHIDRHGFLYEIVPAEMS